MPLTTRAIGLLLTLGMLAPVAWAAGGGAQEQAPPTRRAFTVTAKDFRFSPDRLEVGKDEIVRVTIESQDVAYSFTIDAYRVSRRVPAGGSVTVEIHADREGTFPFYSNLTSDARHGEMRGQLVVRPR